MISELGCTASARSLLITDTI